MPPPKQRKRYLEPVFDGEELPKTTKHSLSQTHARGSAAPATNDGTASPLSDDGEPASSAPASSPDDSVSGDHRGEPEERDCEEAMSCPSPCGQAPDFSTSDLVTLALDYAIEFGLPWTAIEGLMKLMSFILGREDLPDTKYLFRKFSGISVDAMTFHFYCPECMVLLAECKGDLKMRKEVRVQCSKCKIAYAGAELTSKGHFFVSLPVQEQLSSMLAAEGVARTLMDSLQKISDSCNSSVKSDLTDGNLYRAQRQDLQLGKTDITLTLNSDGSPLFNSSKYSIWPVQMTVNELPPVLRSQNVTVAMLWYGQHHPDMTLLLEAFVKQMDALRSTGIT